MAQTLEQNVSALRDLVQQNALLAQKVERQALGLDRLRIAHDLHDVLALGGKVEIKSAPGHTFMLQLTVPIYCVPLMEVE